MRTARTLVAACAASALGLVGATTVAHADPVTDELTVLCDGIGEDTVTITGDLADGGSAELPDEGPLTLVGEPGFSGQTADGTPVEVEPTGEGVTCTAETTTDGELGEVVPAEQVEQVDAGPDEAVTGRLTFTVDVDEDAVNARAARRTAASTATTPFPFEARLRSYLAGRPGAVGVAVKVPSTGQVYTYTKTNNRNVTASIVKVQVMAAVMLRAQDAGRALTTWEKSKIVPMIRRSDNAATTELFNSLGKGPALDRAAARLGMSGTYADPYNHWGLTSTVPQDQAQLMDHFSRATGVLSATNRSYGMTQMKNIASDQAWGVTAGPPKGTVALKNGWLPRTDGWHVNSIGHVDTTRDYTIGVLTHHNPGTMSSQITTIQGVSHIVWGNRSQMNPAPPPARGKLGDYTGDGKADLMTVATDGSMYLWAGDGAAGFASPRRAARGYADALWFGSPGDVNRDGRADVLIHRGDGRLQLALMTSGGYLATPRTIATGWSSTLSLATGGDVDNNGSLDIVVRRTDGSANLHSIDEAGTRTTYRSLGSPQYLRYTPTIMMAGDVNGDGRADLRGVTQSGTMRLWRSTGTSFAVTDVVSTGWAPEVSLGVPGDIRDTGNRQHELVGIRADGTMRWWYGFNGGTLGGANLLPSTTRSTIFLF